MLGSTRMRRRRARAVLQCVCRTYVCEVFRCALVSVVLSFMLVVHGRQRLSVVGREYRDDDTTTTVSTRTDAEYTRTRRHTCVRACARGACSV
jgi:hypothetical protein